MALRLGSAQRVILSMTTMYASIWNSQPSNMYVSAPKLFGGNG